jgi:hypothetical protein
MKTIFGVPFCILFLFAACSKESSRFKFLTDAVTSSPSSIVINSGAAYTNSQTLILSLSAGNVSEMFITESAGCSSGGVWEGYSATKTFLAGAGDRAVNVYVKFRNLALDESPCYNDSIILDTVVPTASSSVNDSVATLRSEFVSPQIIWAIDSTDVSSSVAYYEIAIGTGTTGASASNAKTWTNVALATSTYVTGMTLTNGTTYYANIRAVDGAGNYGTISSSNGWQALTVDCTTLGADQNFVKIPANPNVGQFTDFCLGKYEAKASVQVGGANLDNGCGGSAVLCDWANRHPPGGTRKPEHRATGTPWVFIQIQEAETECQSIAANVDLPTNAQWMAAARDIESVSSNWRNGSFGVTEVNMGHVFASRAVHIASYTNTSALEILNTADPFDRVVTVACDQTTEDCWNLKRTHTLSSGDIIWDFGGNVDEWIKDYFSMPQAMSAYDGKWAGYNDNMYDTDGLEGGEVYDDRFDLAGANPSASANRKKFAPSNSTLGHRAVGGRFVGTYFLNAPAADAMVRGGKWNSERYGGIYTTYIDTLRRNNNAWMEDGFRCAYQGY